MRDLVSYCCYAVGWLAVCLIAQSTTPVAVCRAQELLNPGVFGVVRPDSLKGDKVIGTAFLMDAQQGYVLTAAHVLQQLDLKTDKDPIQLQIDAILPPHISKGHLPLKLKASIVAGQANVFPKR